MIKLNGLKIVESSGREIPVLDRTGLMMLDCSIGKLGVGYCKAGKIDKKKSTAFVTLIWWGTRNRNTSALILDSIGF
ncbi:MAG: hypothetical protein P8P74_16480 [Crocinitomicaceae bacterium]|nr:hypothetical protein [Crocinitomicaceae bacterium]